MPSEFTDRLRKWIANLDRNIAEGRGLWLLGDVGTGKTTLSMLVTTEARRRNYSIAYYSAPRLLTKIRSTFNSSPGEQTYSELFEQLCSVDLLHIDDLGSENRSEWVLEQFYSIVNERYEREKSIIVTSNHLPGGPNYERIHQERERAKGEEIKREELLEDKIGARTVSRLNEICGDPVLMMGSDERWRLAPRPD